MMMVCASESRLIVYRSLLVLTWYTRSHSWVVALGQGRNGNGPGRWNVFATLSNCGKILKLEFYTIN